MCKKTNLFSFGFIRLAFLIVGCGIASHVDARYVTYSGTISEEGYPLENGFVVAGTFIPGFDPYQFFWVYGDEVGNGLPSSYSDAVDDGAFRPLGPNTLTNSSGVFTDTIYVNGSSHYSSQVWLFCFNHPSPSTGILALCTSTNASWVLDAQDRTLYASDVDQFAYGQPGQGFDIELGIAPMPEPSTIAILCSGVVFLGIMFGTKKRKNKYTP